MYLCTQERHGWERPGWFSKEKGGIAAVKDYDWYGAYETKIHEEHKYRENLNLDYTFGFPAIHNNVTLSKEQFQLALMLCFKLHFTYKKSPHAFRSKPNAWPQGTGLRSSTCPTSESSGSVVQMLKYFL